MPTEIINPNAATAPDERLTWLDLLRIAASFLIVMLNITQNQLRAMPIEVPGWQTINIYLGLSRAATILFTMMSGVLFLGLGKQRSLNQLFQGPLKKIVVIYVFWSFLYAIFALLTQPALRTSSVIPTMLRLTLESSDHMWFLPILISLYLISPFLHLILEQSDKANILYGVALMVLGLLGHTFSMGWDFLPLAEPLQIIVAKFPIGHLLLFAGYFLLGNVIVRYFKPNQLTNWLLYLALPVGVLLNAGLTHFASQQAGGTALTFSTPLSLITFMVAVPVFWLFQSKVSQVSFSAHSKELFAIVARQTLGVYLVHPMVLFGLNKLIRFTPLSFNPIISVPILTLFAFSISAMIIYGLKKVPFMCWIA
jgi:surface polysaccharide O-acyltransferase-like enzyme